MIKEGPQHAIKHNDGTIWQDFICQCGKKIYKREITSHKVEFLVEKNGPGFFKKLILQMLSITNDYKLTCPHCGLDHKVIGIEEKIELLESFKIKKLFKK